MYKFKFFRNFESFFSFKNQFKREGRESSRACGWRSLPVRWGVGVWWLGMVLGCGRIVWRGCSEVWRDAECGVAVGYGVRWCGV